MKKQDAYVHLSDGSVHKTRMTFAEFQDELGDDFFRIHHGCLVAAKAIHSVNSLITLSNGDSLEYSAQHREKINCTAKSARQRSCRKIARGMSESFFRHCLNNAIRQPFFCFSIHNCDFSISDLWIKSANQRVSEFFLSVKEYVRVYNRTLLKRVSAHGKRRQVSAL